MAPQEQPAQAGRAGLNLDKFATSWADLPVLSSRRMLGATADMEQWTAAGGCKPAATTMENYLAKIS